MTRRVTLAWQSKGLLAMRKLMRNRMAAGAAVVAAAAALAAGTAAYPALAAAATGSGTAAPAWKIVKQVPGGDFTTVVAAGRNGGWAFGTSAAGANPKPTAWRRNGSSWTLVPFPGERNETVIAAAATSATDVWAFTTGGAQSRVLRWNGRTWTVQRSFSTAIGGAAVISPADIWVFGQPVFPHPSFGAWHYNGRTWSHVASGHGLEGGSGRSAHDVWAFGGTDVAHWNGSAWSRTSVAHLLPAVQKSHLNDPAVTGVFEQSADSVYATGNGNQEDEGGPVVLLHWNGHRWSKVAGGLFGFGVQPVQPIASDGHGGLWIPMPGSDGQRSYLLHYAGGHLTVASLPGGTGRTSVDTVSRVPGTSQELAGGFTHALNNPGANDAGALLELGS
jgi:hypothetical protein